MAYDPMGYAQARASAIGRTGEIVAGGIQDVFGQISQLAKTAEANRHVVAVQSQMAKTFGDELKKSGVPDDQIAIQVRKFYPPPMKGIDPEKQLQMYVNSSKAADDYLDNWKATQKKQQTQQAVNTGVSDAVQGWSVPQDTGKGFTEQNLGQPAETRSQAIGRYGEAAAKGSVPYQGAKALEDNPQIAGLPEKTNQQIAAEEAAKRKTPEQLAAEEAAKRQNDPLVKWKEKLAQLDLENKKLDEQIKFQKLHGGSNEDLDKVMDASFDRKGVTETQLNKLRNLQKGLKKALQPTFQDALLKKLQDPNDKNAENKVKDMQDDLLKNEYSGGLEQNELNTSLKEVDKRIAILEGELLDQDNTYKQQLKDYKKRHGIKPEEGGGQMGSDKFVVGKLYKDKSGNVAKYLGNGQWGNQ